MTGMIFISYRRGDDPGSTGRMFERLVAEGFASDQLFMDIDSIAPGIDFVRELHQQIEKSEVVLAVIGKGWLEARDASGRRRIDNPEDFVRIEIEAALRQNKRVIPVLLLNAAMPGADDLPDALRALATRHFVRLTHERFRADTQALAKAIRQAFDDAAAARERERHAEAARQQAAERARQQAEEARRAEAERETQDKARQEKEEAWRQSIAGLSAEQIAKAEELAHWDFIKQSTSADDFRDHLARFAGGVCERMARRRLSELEWLALGPERKKEALAAFLTAYPDSPHASDAANELAAIEEREAARARADADRAAARRREDEAAEAAKRDESVAVEPAPSPERVQKIKITSYKGLILAAFLLIFLGGLGITLISTRSTVTPTPVTKAAPQTPCPTSETPRDNAALTAGFKTYGRKVVPGGSFHLINCRDRNSDLMRGWVDAIADVGLSYNTQGNRTLTVDVSSKIDTLLAIRDPRGAWHFNDDGPSGQDPRLVFPKAASGRYLIWVGKYNQSGAGGDAQLTISDR